MKTDFIKRCRLNITGILLFAAITAALAAAPVLAQDRQVTGITVTGHGEVNAVPDIAYVSLGVVTRDESATQAAAENSQIARAIKNAVMAQGVAEKDIQTQGYSVQPWMEYPPSGTPRQLGYEVRNSVRVTVRSIAKVGGVIDAGVKAGANSVEGVSFSIDNDAQIQQRALTLAVADARVRAKTIAQALGVKLGSPISVTSSGYTPVPRPMYSAKISAGAPMETPISPGELTVTQDVTITFAILR